MNLYTYPKTTTRNGATIAVITGTLLLLQGCVVGPKYVPPVV